MDSTVLSVDQVTHQLKALIEGAFPRVVVEGEIVSCRPSSSGHVYFSLRGKKASLPCVAFRSTAQRLPVELRDGVHIQATGSVELYPPHGRYQLVLQWARPSGEGALLVQLEALKRTLQSEGLFSADKKRPLPWLPRRVGIATSPTGAAIRDLVRSIHARFPVPILLAPCAVQGAHAAPALITAIDSLCQVEDVDVIVVGRGGGSLEDLWAFNDEALARVIAACPVPVVSAVGHEIDTPISDLVADARAATPTSAGELIVPSAESVEERIDEVSGRLDAAIARRLRDCQRHQVGLESRLRDPSRLIRDHWRRLDDWAERLELGMSGRLAPARRRLDALEQRLEALHPARQLETAKATLLPLQERLQKAVARHLEASRAALRHSEAHLQSLGPGAVLDRGYAIVRALKTDESPSVVRSSDDISLGGTVEILLSKGALEAEVTAMVHNPLRDETR